MNIIPNGPVPARVLIVGESPDAKDVLSGIPFSGPAGQELTRMLSEAGLHREECFLTYLARSTAPGTWANGRLTPNDISHWIPKTKLAQLTLGKQGGTFLNDRIVSPQIQEGFSLLKKEISLVKPTVIITLGNAATWALTGKYGIADWRGATLLHHSPDGSIKTIPTYNPGFIIKAWNHRAIMVSDLRRVFNILNNPEPDIEYLFQLRPSFRETLTTLETLRQKKVLLSVDIETDIQTQYITCLGIAWSSSEAICIPFVENTKNYWTLEEEFQIVKKLRSLLTSPGVSVIGQNFMFDTQYIYNHWKFVPNFIGDTMFQQHVCFPGMPKKLSFLSSMYCKHHVYWKDMIGNQFKKDN